MKEPILLNSFEMYNYEISDASTEQTLQGNSSIEDAVETNKKIEIQKIPVFKEECCSPSRSENDDINHDNSKKCDFTVQNEETEEYSGEGFKENKKNGNADFTVQRETEKCSRKNFKKNERERDKLKRGGNDTYSDVDDEYENSDEETNNSELRKRSSRRARCLGACFHCGKKFGQNLKQHEMQCNMMPTGGIYLKCALCKFKTKIKNDFKEHLSGHIFGSQSSQTMDVTKSINESFESCDSSIVPEVSKSESVTKASEKRSVNLNSAHETKVCDKKTVSNSLHSTQVYYEMSSLSSNGICETTDLDETIPPQVSVGKTYLRTKNTRLKRKSRRKRFGLKKTKMTKSCSTPLMSEAIESCNLSIASEIPNDKLNKVAFKKVIELQHSSSTFETKVRNKQKVSDKSCSTQVEMVSLSSSNIACETKTLDETIRPQTSTGSIELQITDTKLQNETLKRKIKSRDSSEIHDMQVCNGAVQRQVSNAPYLTRVPIMTIAEAFNITLETEDCDTSHLAKSQNEIISQAPCTTVEIELCDDEDESEKLITSNPSLSCRAIDQDDCDIIVQTTSCDHVIKLKEFDTTQVCNSAAFDEKRQKRKENLSGEEIESNLNQDIQVIKEIPRTPQKSIKGEKKLSPNMFMKARCWSCNINMSAEQRIFRCFRCFKKLSFWCTMCNKEFNSHHSFRYLRNHVLTSLQTPLDQLKCTKCSKSFLALCKLKRHESMCFEHLNVRFDKIPYIQLERCDSLVEYYKDKCMKIENQYKTFEPNMPGDLACSDAENSPQLWQSDYRKEKGRTNNFRTKLKKQFYPVHGKVYKQQSVEDGIQNQLDINFESSFSVEESFETPEPINSSLLVEKPCEPVIDQVFSIQTDPTYFDMINGDDILNCDSLLVGKCSAQKVIHDVPGSIELTPSQVDDDTDLVMMNNVNNVESETPSTSFCSFDERNNVVNNTFWNDGVFNYSNGETTIGNSFSVSKSSASCLKDDEVFLEVVSNRTVNDDSVLQVQCQQEQIQSSETLVEIKPFVEQTSIFKQWIEESSEKRDVINDMVYASFVKNLNEPACKSTNAVPNIQPATDFAEKIDQRIGIIGSITMDQDVTHLDSVIGTSFSTIPLSSGLPEVEVVTTDESQNNTGSKNPALNRFEPRWFTLGYCQKCDAFRNDSSQKIKWKRYKEFCKICKNILTYQCTRCKEKFISLPVIFKHLKNNCVPLKRHQCSLCDYSSVYSKRDVQLHMQRKHGNDCVNCFNCNKSFKCKEDCKAHLKSCGTKKKSEHNLSHKQDAETEAPKFNLNQHQKSIIDYSKLELGLFEEHKKENLEPHSQHCGKNIETQELEMGQHEENKKKIPEIYPEQCVDKREHELKLAFESEQEVFGIDKPEQCTLSTRLLQNSDSTLKHHRKRGIRKVIHESSSLHAIGKKKITKLHHNQREGNAIKRKVPSNHFKSKHSTKISQSSLPVKVECSQCNLSTDTIGIKQRCGKCRNSLKYRCTLCDKIFKNYLNFRGHYMGSHRRSKVDKSQAIKNEILQASQNPKCDIVTNDQEKLALNLAENHKPISHKCCQCDAQFLTQAGLKDHSHNHCSKTAMQSCTQCDFKTHSKTDLNVHMRSQHTDKKLNIRCQKCQRGFSGLGALNRHLKQCD